jgi:hypothetical protein
MFLKRYLSGAAIALSLTACGGGGDTAPAAPDSISPTMPDESLPAFRSTLQSYEANPGTQLLARVTKVDSGAAAPTVALGTYANNDRAMWTWYDTDIATTAKQKTMLDFAVGRKVNLIFVHSESLLSKPALLAGFIDRAAARGIKVELLFGAPEWTMTANHAVPLNLLNRAKSFVAGLTGARPVGIHFDIEPHSLPEWASNQVSLGNQLIDLYAKLQAAKGPGLYLNADIAMGYEYVSITRAGVSKTLSHWMVDITDRTTLMAYRDYALGEDSISSHAAHPVLYAAAQGKQSMVGVETTCNLQPAKITFCEEGSAKLESSISSVSSYFSTTAGYGGMAIHAYGSYRKLAP